MLVLRVRSAVLSFVRSEDAVSAIEFSMIAPVLLAMFMASIEMPRAYMIARRLDNATTTLADLTSGGSYADLSPVFAAVTAIANPYDVSRASIVLTAAGTYDGGSTGRAQVCSSAQSNGQARAVGSSLGPPPAGQAASGSRFVMSEITMTYVPIFPQVSSLVGWTFSFQRTWPVREGKVFNGQPEIVLPGGKPCPL